jgi:hypothetical protein
MVLGLFVREVRRQCEFIALAKDDMNSALAGLSDRPINWEEREVHSRRFWFSAHMLLVSAGCLSKIFFPSRYNTRLHRDRARLLRSVFGIADDHLLKDRRFRDSFEHFDEHLDTWSQTSSTFIDQSFGEVNTFIQYVGAPAPDLEAVAMRNFVPGTSELTFQGKRFDVRATVAAAEELAETADAIDAEVDLWPPRTLPEVRGVMLSDAEADFGLTSEELAPLLAAGVLPVAMHDDSLLVGRAALERLRVRKVLQEFPAVRDGLIHISLRRAAEILQTTVDDVRRLIAEGELAAMPLPLSLDDAFLTRPQVVARAANWRSDGEIEN